MAEASAIPWDEARKLFAQGASEVEVCELLGMTKKAFASLKEQNASFRDFCELGLVVSESWWMKRGRKALDERGFNIRLWELHMQNQYGWAQKNENKDTSPEDNLTPEQLRQRIAPMLGKLVKHMDSDPLLESQVLERLSSKDFDPKRN